MATEEACTVRVNLRVSGADQVGRVWSTGFSDGVKRACEAMGVDPTPMLERQYIPPDESDILERSGVAVLVNERDALLAALNAILETRDPADFRKAEELIARIEKPQAPPAPAPRSYFRCAICRHEHWGGEPCCEHPDACVEILP